MSIYESIIHSSEYDKKTRLQEEEILRLYEAHAQHVQSYNFQCSGSCAPDVQNVHERLCNQGIMGYPPMPNVRICQRHLRLFFDAANNVDAQIAALYVRTFAPEPFFEPCEASCPLLSVPMVLYRARVWYPPWLPIYVCVAHSTLHVCHGNSNVLCANQLQHGSAEEHLRKCVVCRRNGNTDEHLRGQCAACLAGRLCYERCPVGANSIDHHAGHLCFFSKRQLGYLSGEQFSSQSRTAYATDFVAAKRSRARPSGADFAEDLAGVMHSWITYAMAQRKMQRVGRQLRPPDDVVEAIVSHLISTGTDDGVTLTIESRDVWQFVPHLYANFDQTELPRVSEDTLIVHDVCRALVFLYSDFYLRGITLAEFAKRVADRSTAFGSAGLYADCSADEPKARSCRATDMLRDYAVLMNEFRLATLPKIAALPAGTEAPPYLAAQAVRQFPLFFIFIDLQQQPNTN